jgi:hypothetical protein
MGVALLAAAGSLAAAADGFTPIAGWDRHLFPAYLIATATARPSAEAQKQAQGEHLLGDPLGVLGVAVVAPADNAAVKVTILSDSIMQPTTAAVVLPKKGVQYKVLPTIKYDYAALVRSRQTVPLSVTYRVEMAGQEAQEETVKVTLRSINDCPMAYAEGHGATDVSFCFAAYVNEGHPLLDRILQEALRTGAVDSFQGRPGATDDGDEDESPRLVLRQVYALWHVLCQRGVRYSDITTTVGTSQAIASQHVRLLDESLANTQANCVDGSVLFASLLRKIGIEPFLVCVPHHCYVGFFLDDDEEHPVALETTMLGSTGEPDGDTTLEGIENVVDGRWARTASWATFAAAVRTGTENLKKDSQKFTSEKDEDDDYYLIVIEQARELGILPIPFSSATVAKE